MLFTNNAVIMTSQYNTALKFMLVPGGGTFDTRWMGYYGSRTQNVFNDNSAQGSLTGEDSGIAWSWRFDIKPGQILTKTAILSAGEVKNHG